MTRSELLSRVTTTPGVCGGKPCIRGTRIYISIILDSLAEGASWNDLLESYPHLTPDDIRAALAYAAELALENTWKVAAANED